MPSHYQVAEYWTDKKIQDQPVIYDLHVPECWGCGKFVEGLPNTEDIKVLWNSIEGKLQKCHIIPKALGGTYEVDNIFLMCEGCHSEAPNTNNRKAFLIWVAMKREATLEHNPYKEFHDEVNKYCRFYSVNSDEFCRYVAARKNSQIDEKINTHGLHKINSSTFILAWLNEYIEHSKR